MRPNAAADGAVQQTVAVEVGGVVARPVDDHAGVQPAAGHPGQRGIFSQNNFTC